MAGNFRLRKKMSYVIHLVKSKILISFAVTVNVNAGFLMTGLIN